MLFTKRMEYGFIILKAMTDCTKENPKIGKEIVKELNIPQKMAMNILTMLSNHDLIATTKGIKKGYYINKKNISFYDIFIALEGEQKVKVKYNSEEYEEILTDLLIDFLKELKRTVIL